MPFRRRYPRRRTFRRFRRPVRYGRRRFRKRRRFTKRFSGRPRYNRRKLPMIRLLKPGIPEKAFIAMRYEQLVVRAPGAVLDKYTFHGNGLEDPDNTGAGHQPTGWDQWKALYQFYKVQACKMVSYVTNTSSGTDLMGILRATDEGTTAITSYREMRRAASSPFTKSFFRKMTSLSDGRSQPASGIVSMYVKSRQIQPYPTSIGAASAAVGADPADTWDFQFQLIDPLEISNITYELKVNMIYYVELRKPLSTPAAS